MQKKLIALAIAGLASSAAFAQSNVSVYGVVDMYYGIGGGTGGTTQTAVNSGGLAGSRIGFKGVEDLGNGLKALFTLEYAINADSANSSIGTGSAGPVTVGSANARQQFVGLTGGFGTAVAGSLQTAGYDFSAATNALHGTKLNALDNVSPTGIANAGGLINSSSRASNAVAYISPSFGGVTIAVNHARLTEAATPAASMDGFANLLSATYVNGPLTVAGIASNAVVPVGLVGTSTTNVREYGFGGSYDFGVATLKASYLTHKPGQVGGNAPGATNPANKSDKAWQISGIVPVSAVGKVVLGFAKNTIDSTDLSTRSIDDDSSKAYSLAYLHSLSKRTTLYTGYTHISNGKNAALSTALGTVVAAGNTVTGLSQSGTSSHTFVAGINHSF